MGLVSKKITLGRHRTSGDNRSTVEFLRQLLEYESGSSLAVENLPKPWRYSAVLPVVSMMERKNSERGCTEYPA